MRILLDTCTFLWTCTDSSRLSVIARDSLLDAANDLILSAASAWEIGVKAASGKLTLPVPAGEFLPSRRNAYGIRSLGIDEEAALLSARLPRHHSDPFDRLIVAQALLHGLLILTPDEQIRAYPIRWLW